jgi:hypothetical protein
MTIVSLLKSLEVNWKTISEISEMPTEMLNYQNNRTSVRVEARKRWDPRTEGLGR